MKSRTVLQFYLIIYFKKLIIIISIPMIFIDEIK